MQRLGVEVAHIKARITSAFRTMRREGLLARQYTNCCSSCANAQLEQILRERGRRGKLYDGYAHFHKQDGEAFAQIKYAVGPFIGDDPWALLVEVTPPDALLEKWKAATLHIRYGSTKQFNDTASRNAVAIAKIIQASLSTHAVASTWDGNPDRCVAVPLLQDYIPRPKGAA